MTPGITGRPGKWPWKYHSLAVTPLIPTMRLASASYSTMRSTSRNGQRCGMSDSISRVVWMGSVTGDSRTVDGQCAASRRGHAAWSVQVCIARSRPGRGRTGWISTGRGRQGSRSRRRGQERRAPDAVEQVGRHAALEERLVGEQRLVDRAVRDEPVDDQLVERHAPPGDGRLAIRAPHDQLAKERIVEGWDLVAAEQVRVHPDARPARRVIALDAAGPGPELVLGI